ncbi:hypothetical protein FQN51_004992 [Onygenales sp. PD_10]|nr:hypothetical protein FQN51_004992 [Onygenales sp. PD_10]
MFGLRDIIIALVWLLLVVVSRLWWKLAVHRRRFGDLPKPPHSFLFGHIALYFKVAKQLAPDTPITVVFDEIRVQYNLPDVYYIDLWPLTVPFLITGDLAVANKFLNDYLRHPASLVAGLQSLTGGTRGLVSAHPYEWHSARSMIRPVFSVTNVQRFIPDMAQYSMQLRTKLVAHAKTSRPFPLIKLVEQWGADLTFRFILGQDAAVQQDGWGADINNRFQAIIAQADGPFTIDPLAARQHRKVQHRLQAQVREKIRNILLNALHSDQPVQPNNYVSLVDSLAAKHREEFPGKSEWDDILTQHMDTMMTLFLAADISSMVLTYVFCHLAQNPDVVAKLREEHNAVFPGDTHATLRAIQENPGKIKELLYTSAVIKESLRLRPPGISPTMAPKGHTVTYNGTEHSLDGFMEENLSFAISQLRSDHQVPNLSTHYDGGQCRVFRVDFMDGESWAVRVPLFVRNASREAIVGLVQCEANVLRELEIKDFRWAAKLRGCSLTFDNDVGYPFVALTWIPGSPLSWSDDVPPRTVRDKILNQMAVIHVSLIECTKENSRVTATEYFSRIIENKIRRVRNGLLPEISEQDCFDQRNILSDVLLPELDNAPFTMDHGDLSPQNILVDSELNVTGVIDWGFSAKVPFQMAAGFPRFLRLQPPVLPPSPVLRKDRESYITSLRGQSSQLVSRMVLVQSPPDVDFQIYFLDSVISKGTHRWLASNQWTLPSHGSHIDEGGNKQ